MLSRDQAKAITDKVLSLSKADEVFVSLNGGTTTHLRFARNAPSTSGSFEQPSLTISSSVGARTGSVTVNQLDAETLGQAVRRSEEMARLLPEDPEFVPVLEAQTYAEVNAFSDQTASQGAELMADGVARLVKEAARADLVAAGFAETAARYTCVASSKGLFGYHRSTTAYVAQTVRTTDGTGSGWASAASHRISDIDFGEIARMAMTKARQSARPREIEPGPYVAVLEPACVANLMSLLMWNLDARRADEGRSYFSAPNGKNRRGEALFGKAMNLYSDPRDPSAPGMPWGDGGLPHTRRDWVKDGRLANLVTDRYWAKQSQAEPIPAPSNVIMPGGQGTVEELVASTERGVLVTSFWYIRLVDPRTILFTGLTRDGVFWIENGKIAHPVRNMRWNESPISVLKNTLAMSTSVRVPPRPWREPSYVMPGLKVKDFLFTSASDAV